MLFYFTPVCPGLRAGGGRGEGGGDLLEKISKIPGKIVKRNSDRKEAGGPSKQEGGRFQALGNYEKEEGAYRKEFERF